MSSEKLLRKHLERGCRRGVLVVPKARGHHALGPHLPNKNDLRPYGMSMSWPITAYHRQPAKPSFSRRSSKSRAGLAKLNFDSSRGETYRSEYWKQCQKREVYDDSPLCPCPSSASHRGRKCSTSDPQRWACAVPQTNQLLVKTPANKATESTAQRDRSLRSCAASLVAQALHRLSLSPQASQRTRAGSYCLGPNKSLGR